MYISKVFKKIQAFETFIELLLGFISPETSFFIDKYWNNCWTYFCNGHSLDHLYNWRRPSLNWNSWGCRARKKFQLDGFQQNDMNRCILAGHQFWSITFLTMSTFQSSWKKVFSTKTMNVTAVLICLLKKHII